MKLIYSSLPFVDDFWDEGPRASREDETIVARGERKLQPEPPAAPRWHGTDESESAVKHD